MGFSSIDDFINEVTTNGKFWRTDFMKGTTGLGTVVAGRWYDLTYFNGNPPNWVHGNNITNYDFLSGINGWTAGTSNWAYTPATHLMTRTANADLSTLSANTLCESGIQYKVIFTMTRSAGSLTPSLGGKAMTARSAAGTYTEVVTCGSQTNAPIVFTPDASFAGTVDLVIVQRHLAWTPYCANQTIGRDVFTYTGGDVSPDTKHITNLGVYGNATTTAPSVIMLVDLLGCYPHIQTDTGTTQTLSQGTNFVANGTFTGSDSGWLTPEGWGYVSNAMLKSGDTTSALTQTTSIVPKSGLTYEVTYTISNWTVGDITVGFGGASASTRTIGTSGGTSGGTFTEIITAVNNYGNLTFTPSNDARFTIDTISCYFGIPRYSDGVGVRAFYSLQSANGANASNFVMSYTNTNSVTGKTLGSTVAQTASAIVGHIAHSGVAANNFGPFLPYANGDVGIRSIQTCQFTAAQATAAGCVNLVLCKPLVSIPVTTGFVAAERDLMNQLPSLPQIKDGAVLGILVFAGAVIAAGNQYMGYIDSTWG